MESVNPDLLKERSGASFNPDDLTYIIDGGIEKTTRRRHIYHLVITEPSLKASNVDLVSRQEAFRIKGKQHASLIRFLRERGITDPESTAWAKSLVTLQDMSAFSLHDTAFIPAFTLLADDEQKRVWLPRMENYEIIGCYAQTELGHGSFIRGAETQAVFDPDRQEFVFNSPSLTSAKFWVGNLGMMATHAIIMAQLVTQGRDQGLHPFLVQIRSLDDHSLLPGLEAGDIGPKFGTNNGDNGFMRLTNVRAPRHSLLGRTGKVSPDGTYKPPKNRMLAYGGMTGIRAGIPLSAARELSMACTIAIRYSCVRRQSELKPGQGEPQVLDYQTQQNKSFPQLATAYALTFSSKALMAQYQEIHKKMMVGVFTGLNEMHIMSATMKAVSTFKAHHGISACRACCGGHAYSLASGFGQLYTKALVSFTAEGEHTLLLLQTAKFLARTYVHLQQNKQLTHSVEYMKTYKDVVDQMKFTGDIDIDKLLSMIEYKSLMKLQYACQRMQATSSDSSDAFNKNAVPLCAAAEAYAEVLIYRPFVESVHKIFSVNPTVAKAVENLCLLYGICDVLANADVFLENGSISRFELLELKERKYTLYADLRPDAVALVDAFDHPDQALHSVLGRYDGEVYPNLLQYARDSPLNDPEYAKNIPEILEPLRKAKL